VYKESQLILYKIVGSFSFIGRLILKYVIVINFDSFIVLMSFLLEGQFGDKYLGTRFALVKGF